MPAAREQAWLTLAMASTLSGNLTPVASVCHGGRVTGAGLPVPVSVPARELRVNRVVGGFALSWPACGIV